MKKIIILAILFSVPTSVLSLKFGDVEIDQKTLQEIIQKADKTACSVWCPHISKPKEIAERLAGKTLVLHKDIALQIKEVQNREKLSYKKAKKRVHESESFKAATTPRAIEYLIDLCIDPCGTRRIDDCKRAITRAILKRFPLALAEYEFLIGRDIRTQDYYKNPEQYKEQYEQWISNHCKSTLPKEDTLR